MDARFQNIISTVEPLPDPIYGPLYRCALTLKDGTHLPCVVIQSKQKIVDLAKRRIKDELAGKGCLGGPDPYGQIVSNFATGGNRINDYDVASAEPSKFAPPIALLRQIHGETTMAWTGWVFEMTSGEMFAYGSSFRMEFLQLPEGYDFSDVAKVHNHSFLTEGGSLAALTQGGMLPQGYDRNAIFRERVHFTCAITDI